jgi:hypothetical protein
MIYPESGITVLTAQCADGGGALGGHVDEGKCSVEKSLHRHHEWVCFQDPTSDTGVVFVAVLFTEFQYFLCALTGGV